VEAKEEILIQKKTIQRVSDLNLRHQEKILKLENENEQLQTKLCNLQSEYDNFKGMRQPSSIFSTHCSDLKKLK
jgi:molecular chaperone GrpE (heat shock protein)